MRTKLRILTVVLLITISVYAGIVFSEHSRNADRVYDDFYAETNFADLWRQVMILNTKTTSPVHVLQLNTKHVKQASFDGTIQNRCRLDCIKILWY